MGKTIEESIKKAAAFLKCSVKRMQEIHEIGDEILNNPPTTTYGLIEQIKKTATTDDEKLFMGVQLSRRLTEYCYDVPNPIDQLLTEISQEKSLPGGNHA